MDFSGLTTFFPPVVHSVYKPTRKLRAVNASCFLTFTKSAPRLKKQAVSTHWLPRVKTMPTFPRQFCGCELVTDFSRLETFSADWERLWQADPDAEIFQSFTWVRAWWRCYRDRAVLRSCVVFEGERVIGIVPLAKQDDQLFFLGGMQSDYGDILCEEGRTEEVLEAAIEMLLQVRDWKECLLRNLKVGGRISEQLGRLPRGLRRKLHTAPGEDCHAILLGDSGDSLALVLGKDHTKRRLNKLRKAGALTFRHIESKEEAQVQLRDFLHHQIRRRTLAGKTSIAPEFSEFLRSLINEFDLTKELRFGVLELNGRSLAWHLSFHTKGKLLFYQQTFDVDAWDYSPGEVLIHELLHYAQENVTREVDFARGSEPFKDRFTTHTRESFSLYIEPPGIGGQLRRAWHASTAPGLLLWQHMQRRAKRHPRLFHHFRSMRLWASGIMARVLYHHEHGTLTRYVWKSVVRWFHSLRFPGRHINFFPSHSGDERLTCFALLSDSGLRVRKGGIGDLVDIALQHPEVIVASELVKYRQRLKQGDQVYLVCQGGEAVLVAWTTKAERGDLLRFEMGQNVLRGARVLLIYECRPVCNALENLHCRELLRTVSMEAQRNGLVLGVCCQNPMLSLSSSFMCQKPC